MSKKAEARRQKADVANSRQLVLPSASCLLPSSPRNIVDLPWPETFEELVDLIELEFRIARLDDEEELIARRLRESLDVEDRVIRHRQSVEAEHAEHRAECSEKNHALERDRDPRRPAVERLAADVHRIADHVRVPAHEEAAETAEDAAGEDDLREIRQVKPDRLGQTVDRKRRVRFEIGVAGLARAIGRIEQRLRIEELGDDAVRPFERLADRHHSSSSPCPAVCAAGSIVRISKMEIIGRNLMKRNSRKMNRPIEPMNIDQSHFVPWYMPQDDGRKSRLSEVGMITKRSSHMPTFTNIAVMKSTSVLVRNRFTHMSCGANPLQTIRAMYIFEYGPKMRFHIMYR